MMVRQELLVQQVQQAPLVLLACLARQARQDLKVFRD
jgi:hypothetical protein